MMNLQYGIFKNNGLLALALALFLGGCGGTREEAVEFQATRQGPVAAETVPVRIAKVSNVSGQPEYDQLGLYLHLKAAQILEASGRYQVSEDETLSQAESLLGEFLREEPKIAVEIELVEVKESSGGTVKIGFFSSQSKKAEVKVRWRVVDLATGKTRLLEGRGESAKGAWGVIAQVDRQSMLKGEGYWEMDSSALGLAAAKALDEAFGRF
jgi:hypothetical protein